MNQTFSIISRLEARELFFIEEIHRLLTEPEKVLIISEESSDVTDGWIVMLAEPGSGDWNIARMLGSSEKAFSLLHRLPGVELQLLVPDDAVLEVTENLEPAGYLEFFTSAEAPDVTIDTPDRVLNLEFKEKICLNNKELALYLFESGKISAYIKSIRYSYHFIEVYIEVEPGLRSRGVGSWLLQQAIKRVRSWNHQLVYVVDSENNPSLAVARKAGLIRFMRLRRLLLKN